MGEKEEGILRLAVQNFGGWPLDIKNDKNGGIRAYIQRAQLDVLGIPEANVAWNQLNEASRLDERTFGWWEQRNISVAYNTNVKDPPQYLHGGVIQLAMGPVVNKIRGTGYDPTKLGRWTWQRFQGMNGLYLRVITVYRPVKSNGLETVYQQQRDYFLGKDVDTCPREQFFLDLGRELRKWFDMGDQLVVMGDFNDDVRGQPVSSFFHQFGMKDVCINKHGTTAPNTYIDGRNPIDGIMVSATLLNGICGYLGFGQAIAGDHRLLFYDVFTRVAFGSKLPQIITANARRLKCEDPRVVKRYNDTLEKFCDQHKLHTKAEQLRTADCTPETAALYEAISKTYQEGRQHAESKCRKFCAGNTPYTPARQDIGARIVFWKKALKRRQGKRVGLRYLRRLARAAQVQEPINTFSEETMKEEYAQAKEEMSFVTKSADAKRNTWLDGLITAQAAESKTKKATHWKQYRQRENARQVARQIRRVNGTARTSGGLSEVIAIDPDNVTGPWVHHTEKEPIENACLREAETRFTQSHPTPFLQQPLLDDFGLFGDTAATDQVLAGTYEPKPGTDPYAVKLLPFLARPPGVKEGKKEMTEEEYRYGWQQARESTASSYSKIHFGHYKASSRSTKQLALDFILANFPYRTAYTPRRWLHGINVMLEKMQGNFHVNKLRIILLYEADFNQNNKFMGRDMMKCAEEAGMLAPEQYGSRKNHQAIDHGLNKTLTFDQFRFQRTPAAVCANDAKSCYDRIVHAIATICMRRCGVPEGPIICMFTTIQNLEHHIRTLYGDSTVSQGGNLWVLPVSGVGQGNGAGPAIWAVVSTPVLDMMRAMGFGAIFKTAMSGDTIQFVGYAFVDDTDSVQTAFHGDSIVEVIRKMQDAIDHWEGGIRATGGALVPVKSHWYLVDFKWNYDGTWGYSTKEEAPGELTVLDATGTRCTIERLEPTEARRTLGVRLALDGNFRAEVEYLHTIATDWADKVRVGHVKRTTAWLNLTSTILRKLSYPLPATYLTKTECEAIMRPILNAALPASGIVRTFPRAMVHAPLKYQGLAVPHLYTVQEISHIIRLMKFGPTKFQLTGKLLSANMQSLRLELGLNGPLMCLDYKKLHSLATKSWIKEVWQFLHANQIRMEDDTPDFPHQREGDSLLMTHFLALRPTPENFERLNRCRIRTKSVYVSCVCDGDGTRISESAWKGDPPVGSSPYEWAIQGPLPPADWTYWQQMLGKALHLHRKELPYKLGRWLEIQGKEQEWEWYYSSAERRLYQRAQDDWTAYPGSGTSRSTTTKFPLAHRIDQAGPLPQDAERTKVYYQGANLKSTGSAKTLPLEKADNQENRQSWETYISSLPLLQQWCFSELYCPDQAQVIAEALRAGTAIAVSDGSFQKAHGTASWVLEGEDQHNHIQGDNVVPGDDEDHSAYRSELSGLYGIVITVHAICQYHHIDQGSITVGCDGESALLKCFSTQQQISPRTDHFDLIVAIRQLMEATPVEWKPRHIPSHQDTDDNNNTLYGPWDRWASLNIDMDNACKAGWHRTYTNRHQLRVNTFYGEPWPLKLPCGRKICRKLDEVLTDCVHRPEAMKYWKGKTSRFASQDAHLIVDWEANARAIKGVPITRRHWVSKHATGFCAVGVVMKQRKKRPTAQCPRCPWPEETVDHVYNCQAPEAGQQWAESLDKLTEWLNDQRTDPAIVRDIREGLNSWRLDPSAGVSPATSSSARAAQEFIGWRPFLEGCLTWEWQAQQQRYYEFLKSRKTGRRWTTLLIRKLWDVSWDMWDDRNGILHKNDNTVKHQEMDQELRRLYTEGPTKVLRTDRSLFNKSVEDWLSSTPFVRRQWVSMVTKSTSRYAHQCAPMNRMRALLSRFLTRVPPIPP